MIPPGRPEGDYRRAQPEGTPVLGKPEAARLPTLTEVLSLPVPGSETGGAPHPAAAATEESVARLAAAIGERLDGLLNDRLDESMAPLLAQFSRAVAEHARAEVRALLREELPRLVAQALQRQG